MSFCVTLGRVLHFPKPQSPSWTVRITGSLQIHACAVNMAMLTGWELWILTFGNVPTKIPKIDCKSSNETQQGFAFTGIALERHTECVYIIPESAYKAWTNPITSASPSARLSGCEREGSNPTALREHWEGRCCSLGPIDEWNLNLFFPNATRWRPRISKWQRSAFGWNY